MDVLKEKIGKEIGAGRVKGPFQEPPFKIFRVSPLGLVPKVQIGEFRIIHDLSSPEGNSMNDGICSDCKSVKYQSVDDACHLILQFGRGCQLAKVDVEHAYKLIPVHPDNFNLFGFALDDGFYFDKTLPMGLSYSCQLFEVFSTSLHWIAENKLGIQGCVHILDDFLFVSPAPARLCQVGLDRFMTMAERIGLPIKQEKTVLPTTCLVFMGLELDTVAMEIRLPLEKCRKMVKKFMARNWTTLRELQSLIGLLNYACAVVLPGRTFLRRITDLAYNNQTKRGGLIRRQS
ncbi:uncharacterized protein LOC130053772 [Ostrea edulis]|uniref:uncharacterized protein LOC130053772 n=1 Tax=Ostrea edulis TaxID=37623 RepID=UPI0024AE8879|nr:uncharacterized protein LOC130053772 [Ostrea edulis]